MGGADCLLGSGDATHQPTYAGRPLAGGRGNRFLCVYGDFTGYRTSRGYSRTLGYRESIAYVRDVSFREDHCRVRHQPGNLARLRTIAHNIIQHNHLPNTAEAIFKNALSLIISSDLKDYENLTALPVRQPALNQTFRQRNHIYSFIYSFSATAQAQKVRDAHPTFKIELIERPPMQRTF